MVAKQKRQKRLNRILNLLSRLQSGRNLNSADLADAYGVSRRTVFRDIKTLRDSGVEIHSDEQSQTYVLASARNDGLSSELNFEELFALFVLCHELGSRRNGIPHLQQAQSAVAKLAQTLPASMIQDLEKTVNLVSVNLSSADSVTENLPIFNSLLEAIRSNRCIRVHFRPDDSKRVKSTLLSPYRLLFASKHWHAIGRSAADRTIRLISLEEIEETELLDEKYKIPPRFSLSTFLEKHKIRLDAPEVIEVNE